MLEKTRSLFRTILIFINIGIIIAYLSVCLVPFINTGKHWYFAFPGLGFPLLFFALVCFIILWAVLKSKWFWISLIVMFFGIQQIVAVFSFHLPQDFSPNKQANTLRIMEWNVEGWQYDDEAPDEKTQNIRSAMMNIVKEQNADILCFEEYSDIRNLKGPNSTLSTILKMGYPYYLFAPTDTNENNNGVIIFSRYPIINSDIFNYGEDANAEHLIYMDVKTGENIFRIFTTHLQSVRFEHSDYQSLSRLKRARDPGYRHSRTLISKLKTGYEYRYHQAQTVKQKIAESPYPVIISGDFNDIPNSNTYFTIKGNLQDAFLKKGSWIGRTFRFISPTLRIDYILADKKFKVTQFKIIHVPYSDHYPIVADLQY